MSIKLTKKWLKYVHYIKVVLVLHKNKKLWNNFTFWANTNQVVYIGIWDQALAICISIVVYWNKSWFKNAISAKLWFFFFLKNEFTNWMNSSSWSAFHNNYFHEKMANTNKFLPMYMYSIRNSNLIHGKC